MATILGIHLGHHASCAVVRDGRLVSAVQAERHSRIKNHIIEIFENAIPIGPALKAAGVSLEDVDLIVSSVQATGPAAFGLHQPLIDEAFDGFDVFSARHFIISHHLAHAQGTFATSGFETAAVLVCDYAGSSTHDGQDFGLRFRDWYAQATSETGARGIVTEASSIYRGRVGEALELVHRELAIPHCQPMSFVRSPASLYENVTAATFREHHAHGQLMAMGAYAKEPFPAERMVTIEGEDVTYRNDWQHAIPQRRSFEQSADLAQGCQEATEQAVLAYARKAHRLTGASTLAVAGGLFLNILANTRLSRKGPFSEVWVPSAPHDAGISIGCAFWGAQRAGDLRAPARLRTDRLGVAYDDASVDRALERRRGYVDARPTDPAQVARRLADGEIIARFSGRAEFGPRALGARSLLASPCLAESKSRLNQIKGRQAWRPVAPIIRRASLPQFLDGPPDSPWMTFSHDIPARYREKLPALSHPDGSTRAQTLERPEDPWLYDLLGEFEALTGFPILVNTSLNGPGQPILETPEQAIEWYLPAADVDELLLNDRIVKRRPAEEALRRTTLQWAPESVISFLGEGPDQVVVVLRGRSFRLSPTFAALALGLRSPRPLSSLIEEHGAAVIEEAHGLVVRGFLLARPGALSVEPLSPGHAEALFPFVTDERLYRYIPGRPPVSVEALTTEYRRLLAGPPADRGETWLNWVASEAGRPIGTLQATQFADKSAILGYVIFPPHWGRGLGTEGCRWLLRELFSSREATLVRAYVDRRNVASVRLLSRLGLRRLSAEEAGDVAPEDDVFEMTASQWSAAE